MTDDEARGLEHAWRYFALHAEQRMTVFNFFVASAGLTLTGLAWTLSEGVKYWPLGAAAGVSAAALSFIFWRLDQRGAQLVKTAEAAMVALENGLPTSAAVTTAERQLTSNGAWMGLSTPWTFGRSFRLLFAVVFLLGIGGAVVTTCLGTLSGPTHPSGTTSGRPALSAHTRKSRSSLAQSSVSNAMNRVHHDELKSSCVHNVSGAPKKLIKTAPRETSSESHLSVEKRAVQEPEPGCRPEPLERGVY